MYYWALTEMPALQTLRPLCYNSSPISRFLSPTMLRFSPRAKKTKTKKGGEEKKWKTISSSVLWGYEYGLMESYGVITTLRTERHISAPLGLPEWFIMPY